MLLSLSQWLLAQFPEWGFLRVFQYLTFRAVMSAMTALLIGLSFGPMVIRKLTELKIGQPIRDYGLQSHLVKSGTPTMGGVLILIGVGVSTLLWFDSLRSTWRSRCRRRPTCGCWSCSCVGFKAGFPTICRPRPT